MVSGNDLKLFVDNYYVLCVERIIGIDVKWYFVKRYVYWWIGLVFYLIVVCRWDWKCLFVYFDVERNVFL